MTEEALALLRGWHRLQEQSHTCVAACHAIVDAWRGGSGSELPRHPAVGGEFLDPADGANIDLIAARVKRGVVAIVSVLGPSWMELARLKGMRSPYGDLGDGLHAVVVLHFDPATRIFIALDPYFGPDVQPTHVSRDDFAATWSGQVEFLSR